MPLLFAVGPGAPASFQAQLDAATSRYSRWSDAVSITPKVAIAISTVIGGAELALENSLVDHVTTIENSFTAVVTGINAISGCLYSIFGYLQNKASTDKTTLINQGIQNNWFLPNQVPPILNSISMQPYLAPAANNPQHSSEPALSDQQQILADSVGLRYRAG